MKTRSPAFLIFLSLLALSPSLFSYFLPTVYVTACPAVERGLAFLRARYNPTLGLLNEAPTTAPHTYWLTNDNVLAAFVLARLGQTELSSTLWVSVRHYGSDSNGLIEVLWGVPVEFPPYQPTTVVVTQIGEDVIQQENRLSGKLMQDWSEYADLSLWEALNAYQQGRTVEALDTFSHAMTMWDGTGFRDKVNPNGPPSTYATYKLALALVVGTAIQAPVPDVNKLRAALLAMQRVDGGFITDYTDPGHPNGDANTETTSLALLALSGKCP